MNPIAGFKGEPAEHGESPLVSVLLLFPVSLSIIGFNNEPCFH